MFPNMLLTAPSHLAGEVWVLEKLGAGCGGLGDVAYKDAASSLDLHRDSAGPARDHGARLPQRLSHHEPEAFPNGFLDHHVGHGLESVDLDGADVGQVGGEAEGAAADGAVTGSVPVVPA